MAHGTLQRIEAEAEEVQSHASKFKLDLQVRCCRARDCVCMAILKRKG